MSQKRHMLPLFSGLTLFLAFAVHLAALAGPEAVLSVWVWVFLQVGKPRVVSPSAPASAVITSRFDD